ncbi:MAG: chemotaxis protein [Lachnospiraceae bacterium]
MSKGNPTAQTIASEKYQKKAGYTTKGFKIKKELADEFTKACQEKGESQASVISRMMREYIIDAINK